MYHLNLTVNSFVAIFYTVIYSLIIIICVLIAVAYFTLLDRKIMAAVQRRKGPNVVGI
jgi:NADH:ubiquinone oxidoreductase subunit H